MIHLGVVGIQVGNIRRGGLFGRTGAWRQSGYRKCRSCRNAPHNRCDVDGSPQVFGKKRPPRTGAFKWSVFGLGLWRHLIFRALLTHVHPISCLGRWATIFRTASVTIVPGPYNYGAHRPCEVYRPLCRRLPTQNAALFTENMGTTCPSHPRSGLTS